MRKVHYWFIGFLVAVSLPVAYAGGAEKPSSPHFVKHAMKVSPFDAINAQGYFNVVVVRSKKPSKKPKVTISGYPSEPIKVHVSHHTLYLKSPWHPIPGFNRPEVVTVYTNQLKGLTVAGPTSVRAMDLRSNGLDVKSSGTGNILLRGDIKLNQIQQRGHNQISIRWVNSSTIHINSKGSGSIRLAGVAKALFARLRNNATLHTQYLRTHYVQVQTKNEASAYVCPIETLRAFAFDDSNIYYYKYPKNITRQSIQSGNILQMAWHQ